MIRKLKIYSILFISFTVKAQINSNNQYIDSVQSKPTKEKDKPSDTYNVISNNQTGGITAGKVEIHVSNQEQLNNIPISENYQVNLDTVNLIMEFAPMAGKWQKPFIAVLVEEKEKLGDFNFGGIMEGAALGIYTNLNGINIFGNGVGITAYNSRPVTSEYICQSRFNSLPTIIIFGDYQKTMYKFDVRKGTISLL